MPESVILRVMGIELMASGDWLLLEKEAQEEFYKKDSSYETEEEIWKRIARKYGLTENLDEISLKWKMEAERESILPEQKKIISQVQEVLF